MNENKINILDFNKEKRKRLIMYIKNKNYIIFLVIIILSIISFIFAERVYLKVMDNAPNFILENFLTKKKYDFSKVRNKKLVLLWFSNFCKGCQRSFPDMEKIKNLYEKKGVDFLVISVLREDKKTILEAIKKNKPNLNIYYDPKGEVTKIFCGEYIVKYEAGFCPLKNIFIIGKDGKILYASHYPSGMEDEIMESLDKAIGGGEVKNK